MLNKNRNGVTGGTEGDMKKRTKRIRNGAGNDRWTGLILPYCRHAAENVGFFTRVTEQLNASTGMRYKPQQIRQWLTDDDAARVEPKAGVAAYLLDACKSLVEKS